MTGTSVILERDGAVAHVRLNRPEVLNALDLPMAQAFAAAVRDVASDDAVRAVVISGAGRAFLAGGDLAQFRADPAGMAPLMIEPLHAAVRMLAEMPAPVVASVQGAVAGAGLSLALACDLTIASDDARFNLAYINVATSCDLSGSWSLPRVVGLRKALEIALLGESFDAAEALRLGIVNRVVSRGELEAETAGLAQRLATGPAFALTRMKRLMRQSFDNDLEAQLAAERDSFCACAATRDFAAAIEAFFARRPPVFTGA